METQESPTGVQGAYAETREKKIIRGRPSGQADRLAALLHDLSTWTAGTPAHREALREWRARHAGRHGVTIATARSDFEILLHLPAVVRSHVLVDGERVPWLSLRTAPQAPPAAPRPEASLDPTPPAPPASRRLLRARSDVSAPMQKVRPLRATRAAFSALEGQREGPYPFLSVLDEARTWRPEMTERELRRVLKRGSATGVFTLHAPDLWSRYAGGGRAHARARGHA